MKIEMNGRTHSRRKSDNILCTPMRRCVIPLCSLYLSRACMGDKTINIQKCWNECAHTHTHRRATERSSPRAYSTTAPFIRIYIKLFRSAKCIYFFEYTLIHTRSIGRVPSYSAQYHNDNAAAAVFAVLFHFDNWVCAMCLHENLHFICPPSVMLFQLDMIGD